VIASVYISGSWWRTDGWNVIALESDIAMASVVVGAAGITGSAWLLVLGFAAHGLKDAWQQRRQHVSGTRWSPFCAAVDWVGCFGIGIEILAGIHLMP
jgi:hypothetical protein